MVAALPLPNLLLPDTAGVALADAVASTPPTASVGVAEALSRLMVGEFRAGDSTDALLWTGCTACAVEDGVYPIPVPEEPVALCPRPFVGGGAVLPPMRLPTNVLKLFNSVPSSFNRVSVASFCPSIALGIKSRKLRISSVFRLESSSRFLSASFSELRTDSSSPRAESNRVVRLSSAALSAVVSVFNCSRSANAFSKDWSISVLSCSSCGGVGGAIKGIMYRYMLLVNYSAAGWLKRPGIFILKWPKVYTFDCSSSVA